ncbi:MAG: methyltransferase domain-containing protein [Candidatus Latescibacteria bacterium]|nr:methyltransferase domain-containing protein [Candidatus Latescibacterota bacterium]
MTEATSTKWHELWKHMPADQYYPWKFALPPNNGEDAYWILVAKHLSPDADVLEAGCGYGRDAVAIAPRCRSLVAYDRLPECIDWTRRQVQQQHIDNATFVCTDSRADANNGRVTIPAKPDQFDLLVSRRGPTNWLEDARRVARKGARLIQLNPVAQPVPPWNDELPEALRFPILEPDTIRQRIERRLAVSGLQIDSCWTFDVPAFFESIEEFYRSRTFGWDQAPPLAELRSDLERIFATHAGPQGLGVRFCRFLWQGLVE